MARLIFVLVLIAAGVACVGWYRGWFEVTEDNNKINLMTDTNKILADEKLAKEKILAEEKKAAEKLKEMGTKVKETVSP